MSLKQKVKLELADGSEVEVTYDGRDLRAWEVKHRKSALVEDMSLGMLTWLGWSAGKRQGLLNGSYGTYEAFDAECVSVEGMRDEEEADPPRRRRGSPKSPGDGSSAP